MVKGSQAKMASMCCYNWGKANRFKKSRVCDGSVSFYISYAIYFLCKTHELNTHVESQSVRVPYHVFYFRAARVSMKPLKRRSVLTIQRVQK